MLKKKKYNNAEIIPTGIYIVALDKLALLGLTWYL